jgi:hypothetical protein
MTKKDYELIAACIGASMTDTRNCQNTIYDIARRLNVELKLDNPRFDTDRFFALVEHWRKSHGGN